jgi:hypothetical protein
VCYFHSKDIYDCNPGDAAALLYFCLFLRTCTVQVQGRFGLILHVLRVLSSVIVLFYFTELVVRCTIIITRVLGYSSTVRTNTRGYSIISLVDPLYYIVQ